MKAILSLSLAFLSTMCWAQVEKAIKQEAKTLVKKMEADKIIFERNSVDQIQEKSNNLKKESLAEPAAATFELQQAKISTEGTEWMGEKAISVSVVPSLEEIFNPKRLHGPAQFDSRIEIAQLKPDVDWQVAIRKCSESVAMVVEKENLTKISRNQYQLNTAVTLGNRYNLCTGQAFANQLTVGIGTAFIIDEDIMMTAAHVLQRPLKDYAIVFGYRIINSLGTAETGIAAEDVYYPVSLEKNYGDLDLIIFKTDRQLNRPALEWEKSKALKKGDEIYMLGYPMGLPQKLAINADLSDNSHHQYFYTSLDSFQGNSGSPVFNYQTHKIIGVLVSGYVDYELHGDCYKTAICRQPYCTGEKVMRIELAFDD
ncbi:hypothetical protein DMB65_04555 [Flavobacterium cheongpyeongense]|uniref:Serine protease n=1 Tax=Flavobacterium cheongpyeongense TaxID=2212651 RepID=A0A2V4BVR2_9FLAO|nr:serine protease [Flavobacterium cheongpyeongense]PXY41840.1 hypothetical protein DMB65_04555 [Flavobacterium cheongpyeongense]